MASWFQTESVPVIAFVSGVGLIVASQTVLPSPGTLLLGVFLLIIGAAMWFVEARGRR